MKYMVMECHPGYAVVLDEEGRFLKVANQKYVVGQTVTNIIEWQNPRKRTGRRWASLAALTACLALVITAMLQGQTAYASVYMTINPEVRIDVNRKDEVICLDGLNSDGENLIKNYPYKEKSLNLVMNELVDRAIQMNYLHEGGQISLAMDTDSDDWSASHSDTLKNGLQEYLDERLSVTIAVTNKKIQENQESDSDLDEEDSDEDLDDEESEQWPASTPLKDSENNDAGDKDDETDGREEAADDDKQIDDTEPDDTDDGENDDISDDDQSENIGEQADDEE